VFILLWALPFSFFLDGVNYVSSFHFIPLFPALCVSSGLFIYELSKFVALKRPFDKREITAQMMMIIGVIV